MPRTAGCGPPPNYSGDLANVINQYRRDRGLPEIPVSPSLTRVAELHVADLAAHPRDRGCNLHSWSEHGAWSACCYTDDLAQAWADLAADDGLLLEAFVPFVRELAVLVARRPGGDTVVYPVVETEQRDHRLHACLAPAPIADDVAAEARRVALRAVAAVGGVGITAVELFETEGGRVLVNELAPRPHNSGHYTIEGCHTSQFANHARAVLDLPLGDPSLRTPHVALVNVLGHRASESVAAQGVDEALQVEGSGVHLYSKATVRPKRKMGHVTVLGSEAADVRARAERAAAALRL